MTDQPDPTGGPPSPAPATGGRAEDSRAEQVLAQALRLMAGGGNAPNPAGGAASGTDDAGDRETRSSGLRRLTTAQLLLLAAIIGLLVGIGAGLVSLMF